MEKAIKEGVVTQKKMEKSNKKRKIIIVVISVIAIIVVGLSGYFVFNRNDTKDNGKYNCSSSELYVSEDGKKFKLNYDYKDNKRIYSLVSDDETIEVSLGDTIDDFTNIYFNDNAWYLLDECNKKIISHYENKNDFVYYRIEKVKDKKIVVVYYYDENDENDKISLVTTASGEIISFNEKYPNGAITKDENIFLVFDNKVIQYDINGKITGTKNFDNVIDYTDYYAFVKRDNLYYAIDFDGFKESKLEKTTYKDSNKEFDLYKISYDNEDGEVSNDYYAYYNGKIARMYGFYNDEKDEKYASYSIEDGGQCSEHNFLINKKTKEIEKYANVWLGFIKTKNGYYFTSSECATEPTTDIYTEDWRLLGTYLADSEDCIDSQGNIYVRDKSDIVKYDINGKELLRNLNYKEIGSGVVVDDSLYVIVKDNKNVIHLLNLENNTKVEIPTKKYEFSDLWLNIYIHTLDDKSGLSIGWFDWDDEKEIEKEIKFKYDFSTKKLEEINK